MGTRERVRTTVCTPSCPFNSTGLSTLRFVVGKLYYLSLLVATRLNHEYFPAMLMIAASYGPVMLLMGIIRQQPCVLTGHGITAVRSPNLISIEVTYQRSRPSEVHGNLVRKVHRSSLLWTT